MERFQRGEQATQRRGRPGRYAALYELDQKISINRPMTTSRPIRKMMPMVLPRNFNMAVSSRVFLILTGSAGQNSRRGRRCHLTTPIR